MPSFVALLLALLITIAWGVAHPGDRVPSGEQASSPLLGDLLTRPPLPGAASSTPAPADPDSAPDPDPAPASPSPSVDGDPTAYRLVGGGQRIFGHGRFLVAYYGTAGTGALGVLGEDRPEVMRRRLAAAASAFDRPGHPVQPVYELIVSVADRRPGPDGSYSHDIDRASVEPYVEAARRHHALLVLDVQPGQEPFPQAVRRWAWALREPFVGLALDPEWRMPRGVVPGTQIGSVSAAEINRTSAWLAALVRRERLPQKLFVLHQFRTSMIRDIGAVRRRPDLAMVQHVDGFGTRSEKRGTYRAVARPGLFTMGFKLFYDEDVRRMGPDAVFALRPRVRFVSFQ